MAPRPRARRAAARRSPGTGAKRSSGGGRGPIWLLVLAALGAVALAVYLNRQPKPAAPPAPAKPPAARPEAGKRPPPAPSRPVPEPPAAEAPDQATELAPVEGVRIALVIDDLGRSLDDLEVLAKLGVPLSYAVLPFETRTAEVVAALAAGKREVLCHLPMEAETGANPGQGALTSDLAPDELAATTTRALDAVPGATGVNNHMGSRLTADAEAMRAILGVVGARKLFFLDSRTSPESVGYKTARALGIAAAERQVFLDRDPEPAAIDAQLARWLEVARERGAAIAIGHPYPATFAALAREVPRARAAGYEFVPVSFLLDSAGEPPI